MLKVLFSVMLVHLLGGCAYKKVELSKSLEEAIRVQDHGRVPLQSFFTPSKYQSIQLSPDGKHVAIQGDLDETTVLYIMTSDFKKLIHIHKIPDRHVFNGTWLNNEKLLITAGKTFGNLDGRSNQGVQYFVNYDGGLAKQLFDSWAGYRVLHLLPDDPNHVVMAKYHQGDDGIPSAVKFNILSGRETLLAKGSGKGSLGVDENGKVRIFVKADSRKDFDAFEVYYRTNDSEAWQELAADFKGLEKARPISFDSGKNLLYLQVSEDGKPYKLVSVNLSTREKKDVFAHPEVDISSVIFEDGKVVGLYYDDGIVRFHIIDPNSVKMQLLERLSASFPDRVVAGLSLTRDKSKGIFRTFSDKSPGDFYEIDTQTLAAKYLVSRNLKIDPKKMATQKGVTFKTRDGQKLHGYLTVPNGKKPAKGYPMILLVHGGPHGVRDSYGFNSEAQFFANRGYAVFQVNYRGSGGYGQAFLESGYRQWGLMMQDDLTDSTHWAIKEGIADKDRICIFGGSYGGYAALMGVVKEPDLYRCAIGYVGAYSLLVQAEISDTVEIEAGEKYVTEAIGEEIEDLKARSPAYQAHRIKAPVYLIHGQDDVRVPVENHYIMRDNLKKHGKVFKEMIKPQEGHGFTQKANRFEAYHEMLKFFDEHTAPITKAAH